MRLEVAGLAAGVFLAQVKADLFAFTQCECVVGDFNVFPPENGADFVSGTFSSSSELVCGNRDSLNFPTTQGLAVTANAVVEGGSIDGDFLNLGQWSISLSVEAPAVLPAVVFDDTFLLTLETTEGTDLLNIFIESTGNVVVESDAGSISAGILSPGDVSTITVAVIDVAFPAVCISDSLDATCTNATNIVPNIFLGDVSMALIDNGDVPLFPAVVKGLLISEVNSTTIEDLETELIDDVVVDETPTVPGFVETTFSIKEDATANINLAEALTSLEEGLILVLGEGLGGEADESLLSVTGLFSYTPALNFFGSEEFTFDVGFDFCLREGLEVTLEVEPVADLKTVDDVISVVGKGTTFKERALVGQKIDNSEVPFQGDVIFSQVSGIFSSASGEECLEDIRTSFAIDSGGFIDFCYTLPSDFAPLSSVVESFTIDFAEGLGAVPGELTFTDSPVDDSAGSGSSNAALIALSVVGVVVVGILLAFAVYKIQVAREENGGEGGLVTSLKLLGT